MQLTRATVRAYDSGTHTATVTLAHSSHNPITSVPVDVGIPAAEVVAGRECAVVFFTDDNPNDSAVVSIHRAVPGAPFGETFLDLTDTPAAYTGDAGKVAQVNATEDGLEFAAPSTPVRIIDADGDTEVDTENTADVDQILMTIAGTLRYTMKGTTPHHTLVGDVYINEKLDVGNTGGLGTTLNAQHDGGAVSANVNVLGVGFSVNPTPSADVSIQGLVSQPGVVSSAGRSLIAKGLLFFASALGPGTFAVLTSAECRSFLGSGGTAPVITTMAQFHANSVIGGSSGATAEAHAFRASNQGAGAMTDVYHFRSHPITGGANRYGLRIEDIAGGTIADLINAGPATPHLQLKGTGTWAPGINTAETALWLLAGNNDNPLTKTLRQVKWVDPGAGGANLVAGQRVMILV